MLITLYGPDSYRRLKKLSVITDRYLSKVDQLSYKRFSIDKDSGLEELDAFVSSQSIFSPKKLAVLDEPFEDVDNKDLKTLLKRFEDSQDTTIVINTTKKYPAPFKFLGEEPNKLEEFQTLKEAKLEAFIRSEAKNMGIDIESSDMKLLASSFGGDTWRIITELEQLALKKKTALQDIEPEISYFANLNTLKAGAVKDRIVALERILSGRRDDPGRIFNGLAYRLKDKQEANMYADYDVAVKGGKLEYEEVLLAIALDFQFDPLE